MNHSTQDVDLFSVLFLVVHIPNIMSLVLLMFKSLVQSLIITLQA